jgi:LysM repeat protein
MAKRQCTGLVVLGLMVGLFVCGCSGGSAPPPEEPTGTPTVTETPEPTTDTPEPTRTRVPTQEDEEPTECANDTYIVADGDTLSAIADAAGLPLGALIAANQAEDPNFNASKIYVGQIIVIPVCGVPDVTIAPTSGGQPSGGDLPQPTEPPKDQPLATLGS